MNYKSSPSPVAREAAMFVFPLVLVAAVALLLLSWLIFSKREFK